MGDTAEAAPGLQLRIQHFQWEGPQGSNPAAPVSMVKRVMKRAGDTFFSGASSPATKSAAGKVRVQLSRGDVAYTSIVEDYEAEKNSQELFQYCLEQSTLE